MVDSHAERGHCIESRYDGTDTGDVQVGKEPCAGAGAGATMGLVLGVVRGGDGEGSGDGGRGTAREADKA